MKNIDYYDNNVQSFYDRTINANLTDSYDRFLKLLPTKARILDAGCGVGRDSKYFKNKGHEVTAFDASSGMVNIATRETGLEIHKLCFQDMIFSNEFDGVWANASLLHVPYNDTISVYQRIYNALKANGIFYASYKYGDAYMPTAERDFYNMNELKIIPYFNDLFEVIDIWKNEDVRSKLAPSPDQAWLIFIVKKLQG